MWTLSAIVTLASAALGARAEAKGATNALDDYVAKAESGVPVEDGPNNARRRLYDVPGGPDLTGAGVPDQRWIAPCGSTGWWWSNRKQFAMTRRSC